MFLFSGGIVDIRVHKQQFIHTLFRKKVDFLEAYIMEALPVEVRDNIFEQIFYKDPRDLHRLRRVSKTWKDMIDRCTERLLKIWCKKCSDEIPEKFLDDFVETVMPQSWKEYCSSKPALPHIAKDIYESRNEFPNLDKNSKISFTKFFPSREMGGRRVSRCAVSDKYFAVCFLSANEGERLLRIYPLNDLTHCIKDYRISSVYRLDFFTTDNQEFLIIQDHDGRRSPDSTVLTEFLVNDDLIPANLPAYNDVDLSIYKIVKNQCFTLGRYSDVAHHQFTPNGFEWSTNLSIPCRPTDRRNEEQLPDIQICNDNLFVFIFYYCEKSQSGYPSMTVYQYDIIRQDNGKILFSSPTIYLQMDSVQEGMQLKFGANRIPRRSTICHVDPGELGQWLRKFFYGGQAYTFTIYPYHVLIQGFDKLVIFRGNFRQLIDATKNADPGSKWTVINLKPAIKMGLRINAVHLIHVESSPQFLIANTNETVMINITP